MIIASGLYGMAGRFVTITGPPLWALAVSAIFAGNPDLSQPIGVLLLMGFIMLSCVILRSVSDARRTWSPEERGEVEV